MYRSCMHVGYHGGQATIIIWLHTINTYHSFLWVNTEAVNMECNNFTDVAHLSGTYILHKFYGINDNVTSIGYIMMLNVIKGTCYILSI